jgi:SecD/SecF fusion protein
MMKKFGRRISICLLPLVLGLLVVGMAFRNYYSGQGGFRLGVDLVGGTILIYEVDESKFPDGKLPADWRPEELARRLKTRIDPNDLYNITVRVASRTRFEIILPTGGAYQVAAENATWKELLKTAQEKFPVSTYLAQQGHGTELLAEIYSQYPDKPIQEMREFVDAGVKKYTDAKPEEKKKAWDALISSANEKYPPKEYEIGRGKTSELIALIAANQPPGKAVPVAEILKALNLSQEAGSTKRKRGGMTIEQVLQCKELIAQVGSLEFRIPATTANDDAAISAAKSFFAKAKDDPALKRDLENLALYGKPPPSPTSSGGGTLFDTRLGRYSYSWVELGSDFRHEYGLANPRDPRTGLLLDVKGPQEVPIGPDYQMYWKAHLDRVNGTLTELGAPGGNILVYSREVKNSRLSEKDREKKVEYFALMRDPESPDVRITGEYLAYAAPTLDGKVSFRLKPAGGDLFYDLTRRNKGQPLAVVLDGYVESMARINDAIRTSGEISGQFTQEKIDRTVQVLRSGALPGTLKREPVSENSMGPTLGADTITWGFWSIIGAFIAVMVFMVFYYFFAGFVACVALFANLLLTVAFMVMIDAAFTLPGLAGLVLTLGMAVDANVLIYERIREERKRNLELKRAIQQGYDRALPTIIDTHLSSIFTAIVLYVVGNDQLKGFGISLTVGLVISLFTSLYMTRLIFDIWLDRGWLKKLTMPFDPFSGFKFDFMAWRWVFFTITVGLTVAGGSLFVWRLDSGGLNIDFVGGTAYGGELVKPVTIEQLREALHKTGLSDLSVEQLFISAPGYTDGRASKLFTLRTSEKNVKTVSDAINSAIGGDTGEVRLKKILVGKIEYLPDNKTIAVSFVDPDAEGKPDLNKPVFASRAQVSTELTKVLGDQIATVEAAEKKAEGDAEKTKLQGELKALRALAQQYKVEGLGSDSEGRFQFMEIQFVDTIKPEEKPLVEAAITAMQKAFQDNPIPERLENFDSQLANETQYRALYAIVASWGAILLYLWFRFGNWTFGLAAVLCLIHDLFFTLGAIAACHYIYATPIGQALLLQDFKIDLPSVAALLTLVGYSVNDTIVVFDRIREVRGKNPALTEQMINDSVNQTLSRTILSSLTCFLVVFVLYVIGGEGVHLFAFVMVVGVIVGTYSSIYIAAPLLLMFGEGRVAGAQRPATSPTPAATNA